jgi:uncharacterized damage-inducible protein DinB
MQGALTDAAVASNDARMDAHHLIQKMARNEAWANFRLHTQVGRLIPEAYFLDTRTSFFPSIHQTLTHILYVGEYYVDALEGGDKGPAWWDECRRCEREGSFAFVRHAQAALDRRLLHFVENALAPDSQVRLIRADGVKIETQGDVLLHLFQHQIHHRGQVHAMLSATNVAPPQLDEFFLQQDLALRRDELLALDLAVP